MVKFGLNSHWKINVRVGDTNDFYTGSVIEEDEFSIKLDTIKNEIRIISKRDIVSAKEYVRFDDGGDSKTAE